MKKFVFHCLIILASVDTMAQIDLNWEPLFIEEFSTDQYWNSTNWYSIPGHHWKAHYGNSITHGNREGQIYQYNHCQFDPNEGVIKLVSEFDVEGRIPAHEYCLPANMNGIYPNEIGQNNNQYFFFSGEITAFPYTKFGFGYFEIRCKLPLHNGSFPAFWLYGNGPSCYEEIDIFEYSKGDCEGDVLRGHSSGIWHHPYSGQLQDTVNGVTGGNYAKVFHHLPLFSPDLSQYHTFGCEWMPDYVRWYRDGEVISEYHDIEHIPQFQKTLIVNYAILNRYALGANHQPLGWSGSDVMTIDYVKVYTLRTDCSTDEHITTGTQFANFDHKMKRSITIGSPYGQVIVPGNTNVSMHANEFIVIDGEFEISNGSQMTLSVHACP